MKHILFLLFIIGSFSVFSQNSSKNIIADSRIYDFYPTSKIEIVLKEEPSQIEYWNAIYKNGYEILDEKDVDVDIANLSEIEIVDFEKFNILKENIFPLNKVQYFKIKNTNKVLFVKTENTIKKQNKIYKKLK